MHGIVCRLSTLHVRVSSLLTDLLGITVQRFGVFHTDFFERLWLNSIVRRKGTQLTLAFKGEP